MTKTRQLLSGVAFISLIVAVIIATVFSYQGRFRSTVQYTVMSDRAGLTLTSGAAVKLRGVEVGTVSDVEPTDEGARISIDVHSDRQDLMSDELSVQIVPPTAFGAKYVQLTGPVDASGVTLPPGSVLQADAVTVEINDAFTNLAGVLSATGADRVNGAVTATSELLEGRGESIGGLVEDVDAYLGELNTTLDVLDADLQQAQEVLSVYDTFAPDLLAVLDDVRTTTDTLTTREPQLQQVLGEVESFTATAEPFVSANTAAVVRVLELLESPGQMLRRYSPSLPCILEGTATNGDLAAQAVGGVRSGISTYTKLQPSDDPHEAPGDLFRIGPDLGPNCYGLPAITQADADAPSVDFGTGVAPYANDPKGPGGELATTFFGALAGRLGLR